MITQIIPNLNFPNLLLMVSGVMKDLKTLKYMAAKTSKCMVKGLKKPMNPILLMSEPIMVRKKMFLKMMLKMRKKMRMKMMRMRLKE